MKLELNFQKLAVISDIHSNAFALKAALRNIEHQKVDAIICLGDLLTYGCQPEETLELLIQLSERYPCYFIKGNHDEFYFEQQAGNAYPFSPLLPEFIQESIEWTLTKLNTDLITLFDWKDALQIDTLFFAHANPFEFRNWSYLDSEEKLIAASHALMSRQAKFGCFGHTHRPLLSAITQNHEIYFFEHFLATQSLSELAAESESASFSFAENELKTSLETTEISADLKTTLKEKTPLPQTWQSIICNPGSIGQPRGYPNSLLYLEKDRHQFKIWVSYLEYDIEAMLKTVGTSTLSEFSKTKLASFFKGKL